MFVLLREQEMHRIGVKSNIYLLSLISCTLVANDIVIYEINKIENITLSNGSSITQGGLTIIRDEYLFDKNHSRESNNSISQGVILIDDENITDTTYDIVNIIHVYSIEEN